MITTNFEIYPLDLCEAFLKANIPFKDLRNHSREKKMKDILVHYWSEM